jgi:hypothetical protein
MGERSYPCISIRQPWVWAIFFAGKEIENRDWPTKVRGRVLVHASAGMTRLEWSDFLTVAHGISYERPFPSGLALPAYEELPRGCIFGSVTITNCVEAHDSPWFFGRYGFVLADPKPLPKPIPYKGKLGFFPVPASALANPDPDRGVR